jgi:hypothetical protein
MRWRTHSCVQRSHSCERVWLPHKARIAETIAVVECRERRIANPAKVNNPPHNGRAT